MKDQDQTPGRATRFARWRRESGTWTYSMLALSWSLITAVIAGRPGWAWGVCGVSVAAYLLLFEVGLAYVAVAAWGSHRQLEHEGFIAVLVNLVRSGIDDDGICQELEITGEALRRLKVQLTPDPEGDDPR